MSAPTDTSTRPRAAAPVARSRVKDAWHSAGPPVLLLVALIVVWWFAADALQARARVFSSPGAVLQELGRLLAGETPLGSAYGHLGSTLSRLLTAFVLSFVTGGLLGIAAGRIKDVFDLLDNIVWIFLAVPSVVWVFIFAVAIGRSNAVPIAALSALMTPMVLINVAEGAKSVPTDIMQMSAAFHVGLRQRLADVYVPYLVPYFLGAARVSFALGLKIVIVAEVVALSQGVGYLVVYWRDSVQMAPIVAWGVVLIAFGLAVDYGIFGQIERRVAKWRTTTEHATRALE